MPSTANEKHVAPWLPAAILVCSLLASPRLWAQAPPAPVPGVPGAAPTGGGATVPGGNQPGFPQSPSGGPGQPPPGQPLDWTLSDLLDGVVAMEKAGLPLSRAQAEQIKPALVRVVEASRVMTETEKQIRSILTPQQLALIEQAQRDGKLQPEALAGRPSRPGEDPVIARALEVLQKKAQ